MVFEELSLSSVKMNELCQVYSKKENTLLLHQAQHWEEKAVSPQESFLTNSTRTENRQRVPGEVEIETGRLCCVYRSRHEGSGSNSKECLK